MKNKSDIIGSVFFFSVFILLLVLVKTLDVAAIGPEGTSVGFSTTNKIISDIIGYSSLFYAISKVLGVVSFIPVFLFALLGLSQLIKRRRIARVDRNILTLGGLYFVTFVLYIVFDKIAINYRPLLMEGETFPEPSFPSSHTLMVIVIMLSACLNINYYIKGRKAKKLLKTTALVLMTLVIVTRLLSGVHWLTDILGSIFLGLALVLFYSGIMGSPRKRKKDD